MGSLKLNKHIYWINVYYQYNHRSHGFKYRIKTFLAKDIPQRAKFLYRYELTLSNLEMGTAPIQMPIRYKHEMLNRDDQFVGSHLK